MKFKCKYTEKIHNGKFTKKFGPHLIKAAREQLLVLDKAKNLEDLRNPPGNRLEVLRDDRAGQHSIRINDQWRICFRWIDDEAVDVEVVDYHK